MRFFNFHHLSHVDYYYVMAGPYLVAAVRTWNVSIRLAAPNHAEDQMHLD